MIVVSDATPLSMFIVLGIPDVLASLFGAVVVTPAVLAELAHPSSPDDLKAWSRHPPDWLSVQKPRSVLSADLPQGAGEREAISLAVELGAQLLLADDKRARSAAKALGLNVTGTVGLIRLSAQRGLINLPETVAKLRQTDFRIAPSLLEQLLHGTLPED